MFPLLVPIGSLLLRRVDCPESEQAAQRSATLSARHNALPPATMASGEHISEQSVRFDDDEQFVVSELGLFLVELASVATIGRTPVASDFISRCARGQGFAPDHSGNLADNPHQVELQPARHTPAPPDIHLFDVLQSEPVGDGHLGAAAAPAQVARLWRLHVVGQRCWQPVVRKTSTNHTGRIHPICQLNRDIVAPVSWARVHAALGQVAPRLRNFTQQGKQSGRATAKKSKTCKQAVYCFHMIYIT